MLILLRPAFWAVAVLGALWLLPMAIERLQDVNPVDQARCTLDAAACAKLSNR